MKLRLLTQALLVFYLPLFVNCFYFYSYGGERKCFHKELNKNDILKIAYSVQNYDSNIDGYKTPSASEMDVLIDVLEVFDENHRVVHERRPAAAEYTFNAIDSGEHKICFQPQFHGWLAKVKTKVNIELQVGPASPIDSAKKVAIKQLHQKILDLNYLVKGIRAEQKLVREREMQFRDASERANSSAMWWSIITIVIMGIVCFWQLNHLRTFFVKQKVL